MTFLVFPNIPFTTSMHQLKKKFYGYIHLNNDTREGNYVTHGTDTAEQLIVWKYGKSSVSYHRIVCHFTQCSQVTSSS